MKGEQKALLQQLVPSAHTRRSHGPTPHFPRSESTKEKQQVSGVKKKETLKYLSTGDTKTLFESMKKLLFVDGYSTRVTESHLI